MTRRDFITLVGGAAVGWPLAARAQQSKNIPRLCFLDFMLDPGTLQSTRFEGFFEGLRDLGYVDGQTITIDYLSADGHGERFPNLVAECLRRKVDIIAVSTTPAAQAAKSATHTTPIVMIALGDPVGTGLVNSLANPGGNVTGMSMMVPELAAKRLELKETRKRVLELRGPITVPREIGSLSRMNDDGTNIIVSQQRRDLVFGDRASAAIFVPRRVWIGDKLLHHLLRCYFRAVLGERRPQNRQQLHSDAWLIWSAREVNRRPTCLLRPTTTSMLRNLQQQFPIGVQPIVKTWRLRRLQVLDDTDVVGSPACELAPNR